MLDELPVNEFRKLAQESFTRVATSGEASHGKRDRVIDGRFACYETVIMPLSTDGTSVARLLVGMIYDDERP
jgi:hypothetical protein